MGKQGRGAGSLGLVDLTRSPVCKRQPATTLRTEDGTRQRLDRHERIGAPAWLARSLLHQGVFLGPDGAASLDRAAALADTYGLPIVADQVARARA